MKLSKLNTALALATAVVCGGACVHGQAAFVQPEGHPSWGTALQVPGPVMAGLLLSRVAPEAPANAAGQVVIQVRVSADGNVEKAAVVSGPDALRASALFAVRQFIYRPYRVDGRPVEVESTVAVDFVQGRPSSGEPLPQPVRTTAHPAAAAPAVSPQPQPANVRWVKRSVAAQPAAVPVASTSSVKPNFVAESAAIPAITKPAAKAYRSPAVKPPAAEPVSILPPVLTQWHLVKRVAPMYPAPAELAGVEGVVVVEAIVRKDGSLRELKAVSGPPELRQAALDAASQFEYAPAGGMSPATEAATSASVEFVLKGPAKVPAEVMAGRVQRNVTPTYPAAAEAAGISGAVTLHVLIDRQGRVEKAEAVDGPVALRETALEAVKQWTWQPYLRHGVDVQVETNVIVAFSLQRAGQQ